VSVVIESVLVNFCLFLHITEHLDKARCCRVHCGSNTQTWYSGHSLSHASNHCTIPTASCHPSRPGGTIRDLYINTCH